jgi:hypothetical protein
VSLPPPSSILRARVRRVARATAAALLLASPVPLLAAPATPPAHGTGASQGDCDHLLRQFDVAWAAHRDSPRAAAARHSRDQGEADCRDGHYADGVHHLRRALHDIGLKPVKRVPSR